MTTGAFADSVKTTFRDLKLNGELVQADGESLEGSDVVLILHGTLGHSKMEVIETIQDLFAEEGMNSLAITLSLSKNDRTGFFSCEQAHYHQHETAALEIAHWVEWLKLHKVKRIHLLGHSRGGNQIINYYGNNTKHNGHVATLAPMMDSGKRSPAIENKLKIAEEKIEDGNPNALFDTDAFLHCEDSRVSAKSLVSYYGRDLLKDTPLALGEIKNPTLVITGSSDEVVPGLKERMTLKAPLHKTIVIDGAGHFFRDLYAEEVVENLMDWYSQ